MEAIDFTDRFSSVLYRVICIHVALIGLGVLSEMDARLMRGISGG